MAASKDLVTNKTYYTNPYTESLGYICNEWIVNTLFTSLIPTLTTATASQPSLQGNSSTQAIYSLIITRTRFKQ